MQHLAALLNKHNISQAAMCRGAKLSKAVCHRIVKTGEWPKRDSAAPGRVRAFLECHVPPEVLETAFPKEVAPHVRQHAGAGPEAAKATALTTQEVQMLLQATALTTQAKSLFKLPRNPFSDDINTREDVFSSANIRYVRAALLDTARNCGFMALAAESGAGKTTLMAELEERIREERMPITVIRPYVLAMEENDEKGRTLKSGQITEAIIRTLDPTASPRRTPQALFSQLHALLKSSRAVGNSHLLVIEEAHCLPIATLKHLKRFLELKDGLQRLIGIVLLGQNELKDRLSERKAEVREVVQRCELVELDPLDSELEAYLSLKFARIGINVSDVLEPDVYDALRNRLIEIPRGGKISDAKSICYPLAVNNMMIRAMNAAAVTGFDKVNAQIVEGC
jgi:type II secretory pathway predicted ATPase ExeA